MANNTYVLLAKSTVGAAGAASITFSNIPQTGYTDLVLVSSVRTVRTAGVDTVYLRFNGDNTSGNYSAIRLIGDGSTTSSASNQWTGMALISDSNTTANTFGSTYYYIPNYTSSNQKTVSVDSVGENNGTTAYQSFGAGKWSGTAAITSMSITGDGWPAVANSTFYLYGISNVNTTPTSAPKASGGDIITNDGTYWIHTFLSSGTFTPQTALSCDYLVVAGGGGGGTAGGGGGAGGLRSTVTATGGGGSLESKLSTAANTGYTVTVGAGGAGTPGGSPYPQASDGNSSVFSTITSIYGGGGGGYGGNGAGRNGGSGGGTGCNNGGLTAGTGTANQGYAGGTSGGAGGGGGGAGAVGQSVTGSSNGGNGGNGVATSITGSSVTYAGGGGGAMAGSGLTGGTGGTGGGGNGATTSSGAGSAATANTGGGGGAAGNNGSAAGGNGGSGIVIIRYAMA